MTFLKAAQTDKTDLNYNLNSNNLYLNGIKLKKEDGWHDLRIICVFLMGYFPLGKGTFNDTLKSFYTTVITT